MDDFKAKSADIKLIYKCIDNLKLPMNVYLPNKSVFEARTVLLIHGGGWNDAITDNSSWNGGWMGNNAKYLASKGFIAITVSYRSLKVSYDMSVCDILDDCKDAVDFIKKNLEFVRFDNLICMGDSAGGYLATMLGLSQDDNLRPHIIVACNPVLDCTRKKWLYGFKNVKKIKDYLPFELIKEKSAEFLFLHGTADETVEIEDTVLMNKLLLQNGHKTDIMRISDAKHAFVLYDYKYSDEYVTGIMDRIIEYLNRTEL